MRSRLYLDRPKADDGAQPDPDVRLIKTMKANYSSVGAETRLRWKAGMLRLDGAGLSGLGRLAADADCEATFLSILVQMAEQGRNVSHQPGPTYAPTIFAKTPAANGISRRAFVLAMERLFAAGKIKVEEFGRPSKRRTKITAC